MTTSNALHRQIDAAVKRVTGTLYCTGCYLHRPSEQFIAGSRRCEACRARAIAAREAAQASTTKSRLEREVAAGYRRATTSLLCMDCRQSKPLDQFGPQPKGRPRRCKACNAARQAREQQIRGR